MEYLFTERAHLMCPRMSFGIVMQIDEPLSEVKIQETADVLAEAHPFLKACLGYEEKTDKYYYNIMPQSLITVRFQKESISGIEAPEIMEVFESYTSIEPDLTEGGMLLIVAWSLGEKTGLLMLFHHLLTDGRGALSLAKEFADYYVMDKKPTFAEEKLIASVDEFPIESRMPWISRTLIKRANKQWKKENVKLDYQDYLGFSDQFLSNDPIQHNLSTVESEELLKIVEECRANDVTVNDYLLAKLFTEDQINKIVIAADLRDNLRCYNPGALGNYSTAFSVELKNKAEDFFGLAKQVHDETQNIMRDPKRLYLVLQCYANLEPGLLDAALMAAKGKVESKAAKFVGTQFFGFGEAAGHSITNLGRLKSETIESAYFIPPASPAMKKTLGVLTVNGTMWICTSERNQ